MLKNRAVVTTATMYTGPGVRFDQALAFMAEAQRLGLQVVVNDGTEGDFSKTVREAFRDHGALVQERKRPGLGQPRRDMWQEVRDTSLDVNYFLWTEPEKPSFLAHVPAIVERLAAGDADIVVAGRDPASYATYPLLQQESEVALNGYLTNLTGLVADHAYAPRGWTRDAMGFFLRNQSPLWGSVILPPLDAHLSGVRVIGMELTNVGYPQAQRDEEDRDPAIPPKRWTQLKTLVEETFALVGSRVA